MKRFTLAWLRPRRVATAALAVALVVAFAAPSPQARADREPSPEQLTAIRWQWILHIPVDDNPGFDQTGADAFVNQPFADQGLVFLCGSFTDLEATRSITVPAGTAFFFPVVNYENDEIFYSPRVPVPRLRADAAANEDATFDRHASLNGVDLEQVRLTSPVFAYRLPATGTIDQYFGVDVSGTIAPAVSDGFWCYIPPLKSGTYTLNFGASSGAPPNPITFNITYNITVQ